MRMVWVLGLRQGWQVLCVSDAFVGNQNRYNIDLGVADLNNYRDRSVSFSKITNEIVLFETGS